MSKNTGNPAKRAALQAKDQKKIRNRTRKTPINKQQAFLKLTGLVIVGAMLATLLAGALARIN